MEEHIHHHARKYPSISFHKDRLTLLLVGALFLVEVFSLIPEIRAMPTCPAIDGEAATTDAPAAIPKLSELKGPQIDSEAAMVTVDSAGNTIPVACQTLPIRIWIFLLVAYLGLLAFNLGYEFEKATTLRFGFELFLTLLAFVGWSFWDTARVAGWFPWAALQLGLTTYLFYVVLFLRQEKKSVPEESSRNGSLFDEV